MGISKEREDGYHEGFKIGVESERLRIKQQQQQTALLADAEEKWQAIPIDRRELAIDIYLMCLSHANEPCEIGSTGAILDKIIEAFDKLTPETREESRS